MKRLFYLFLFITTATQAQTLISFQELGLSFEIPNGWNGQLQDEFYIMGHETIPGLMILSQNSSTSSSELKALAMEGVYDEGVQLKPVVNFELKGNNKVEGFYEGTFNGSQHR